MQRHFIGRLHTYECRESVVTFLFGLEVLLTRVSKAQSSAIPLFPKATRLLLAPIAKEPVSNLFSLSMWALGNYRFLPMSSSIFSCTVFLYEVFG
jgi:hypothetical protein